MGKHKFRKEKDSLGEMGVPEEAYYGIQTMRAIINFPISGIRAHREFIDSYAYIKKAAAITNTGLGILDKKKGKAIIQACDEILKGKLTEQFVVDTYQAGAGTSFNMNVNEVIANRGIEILGGTKGNYSKINPNDDVNMAQSTNDTYPTAMRLACLIKTGLLLNTILKLKKTFGRKSAQFNQVIKSGRTHLQDAVPITLGQEFSGYEEITNLHYKIISRSKINLCKLGIGGTAVGTGLNTHKRFRDLIIKNLSRLTGYKFSRAENNFASMQSMYPFLELSSSLKNLCTDLTKISNDIRLLSSGPFTGLNEIVLPSVQPGSSIMPGKINPSIAEMLNMVCYQVMGNDLTTTLASQAGQLELNVMMPLICYNILQSLEILNNAILIFEEKCIKGITANEKTCRFYAQNSLSIVTVLSPMIGYLDTAKIAKEAVESNKPIMEIIRAKKILTGKQYEELSDLIRLTKPGTIEK